jgi:glycosyltransferase involved in cell wall biosynthesis
MTILFINNWELDNALTVATTLPALRILAESPGTEKIVFVTPEHGESRTAVEIDKVIHVPVRLDECTWPSLLKYVCWERQYRKVLSNLAKRYAFDCILARGAPAGGRAWWLHQKTGIPFYVESFEPHADYMHESGVWGKNDPRYLVEKYWEKGATRHAAGLMPVTENYKEALLRRGVSERKVQTVPCTVDVDAFAYSQIERGRVREALGIPPDSIVGIYVGKFGDIYYDQEAFAAFETAFESVPGFELILLSPASEAHIHRRTVEHAGIDARRVHHLLVKPGEVPAYLSAADFAYSLIKCTPSKAYCSPVKIGEYWASGLPVITSKGIGDDAKIIEDEGVGGIFDPQKNNHRRALQDVLDVVEKKSRREIAQLARKYRSRERLAAGYKALGLVE